MSRRTATTCALLCLVVLGDASSPRNPRPQQEESQFVTESGAWRWSRERCTSPDQARVIAPKNLGESEPDPKLFRSTVKDAVKALRLCGVCVVENVFSEEEIQTLGNATMSQFQPLWDSRRRVRQALLEGIRSRIPLSEVWQGVRDEKLFSHGHVYRERRDARIDLSLPLDPPFSNPNVVTNPFIVQTLRQTLGRDMNLKGIQSVVALNVTEGNSMQHWHRDTPLLYEPDEYFDTDVHHRSTGVHLPPYAVNVFIPLVPFTEDNGPTEFTLGSHQWGSVWSDDEHNENVVDHRFTAPVGSIVFFDYRVVHRGTPNWSPDPRPVIMLVYGRPWWHDVVNYGLFNYGGSGHRKPKEGANPMELRQSSGKMVHQEETDESDTFERVVGSLLAEQLAGNGHNADIPGVVEDSAHDKVDADTATEVVAGTVPAGVDDDRQRLLRFYARLWKDSLFRQIESEKARDFDSAWN
jgi:ectoine hydroxylase-related dioxygenase (phytanoyl-CoA dioxygenase family)